MASPERPSSLSHVEKRLAASFQEYYRSSSISQLPPFAGTSRPQEKSANPGKEARNNFGALPTQDSLFQRSSRANGYDNVLLNQQTLRPQFPAHFNANLPVRRKPLASEAIQTNERITPVVVTYPSGAQAPAPASNQYKKPTDSQLFTEDRRYSLASTIYCECEPRLPARRLHTQTTDINRGTWYYVCQKAFRESCQFLLRDDQAKDGEEAAVTYSTPPEDPPPLPSRTPSEPPPYTPALPHIPSVSKKEGSDPTTTAYIMSTPSYIAHSPSARGIERRKGEDFSAIFKSDTLPFDPAGETQSKDDIATNRGQGQCILSIGNPEGGIDSMKLLRPFGEQTSKDNTEVTHYHPEENRLDGKTEYSPTKKRRLGPFVSADYQEISPQKTDSVKNGMNAETVDLFNQTLSRAEAHAMLDRLFDLKLFIKDVRSRLRDLSPQVDAFQRSYTKTRSSVEGGGKDGASTYIPNHSAPVDHIKNTGLPDVQAPVTPRYDK